MGSIVNDGANAVGVDIANVAIGISTVEAGDGLAPQPFRASGTIVKRKRIEPSFFIYFPTLSGLIMCLTVIS